MMLSLSDAIASGRLPDKALMGRVKDEAVITELMVEIAGEILEREYSVIAVAQNLHPHDILRWQDLATQFQSKDEDRFIRLEWLDTRDPKVAAMIPPLEQAA